MLLFSTLYEISLNENSKDQGFSNDRIKKVFDLLNRHGYQGENGVRLNNSYKVPTMVLFTNALKNTVLVNILPDLITIDFNEINEKNEIASHRQKAKSIQRDLSEVLPECTINRTAPLVRGRKMWNYSEFGDGRIVEDGESLVLFKEKSKYQEVVILQTNEFGPTLILDGNENISERGDTYTPALLGIKQGYEHAGKNILILGGGDGAALNYLRKLSPAMITMVEIDELVMQACRQHLRGCCGDSLDNYVGDNYKIIVEDCIKYLKKMKDENEKFDYIISDISDTPVDENDEEISEQNKMALFGEISYDSDFFLDVFNLSLQVLEPNGVIFTHVGATSNKACMKCFENKMKNLDEEVELETNSEFVPAFLESWTFCQIKRPNR